MNKYVTLAVNMMRGLLMNQFKNLEKMKRKGYTAYYYRYTDNNKRMRIPLGTSQSVGKTFLKKLYRDAEIKVTAIRLGIFKEPVDKALNKPVYLGEVLTMYKNEVHHATRSFHSKFYEFRTFVEFFGKKDDWDSENKTINPKCMVDLTKIKTVDIDRYYQDQISQGKAPGTLSNRNKYLAPFYKWLVGREFLDKNYYELKTKLPTGQKTFHQVLDWDIVEQVLTLAPNPYCRKLWTVMAYTGMAPVDACGLVKKNDLNILDGQEYIVTVRAKSKDANKILAQVPMFPELKAMGSDLWEIGGTKKQRDSANVQFRKVIRSLKVKAKKGFVIVQYCLRHSFITHALQQGVDPSTVSDWVGHVDEKMQKQNYRDLTKIPTNHHQLFNNKG